MKKDVLIFATMVLILVGILLLFNGCNWGRRVDPVSSVPDLPPIPSVNTVVHSINWLATIAIIGIALSIAACVNGFKWGLGGAVGSGVALWAIITVNQYAKWLAILGLLLGVFVVIGAALRHRGILTDVIKSVQRAKTAVVAIESAKGIALHETEIVGIRRALQSQKPETRKVVGRIKEKLAIQKLKTGKDY